MRVVLDTNVLLSALIVKVGKPAQIMSRIGSYEFVTSEEVLAETYKALHGRHIQKRYPVTTEEIESYIERLRKASTLIQPNIKVAVVKKDPDDNKFLALAKEVKADYIVSGDSHLTELGEFDGIPILMPAQYLDLLKSREGR